jgi:hypothetical protein
MDANVVEFIPREEYERQMEETFSELSRYTQKLPVPRDAKISRKDVVLAFQNAFELIGGIPRLAVWANENPTDFYKLYARLLPSQASEALGEENVMKVIHVLPRTPLDE